MAKNELWQEGDGDAWKTRKPKLRKKRLNRQVAEERREIATEERWRRVRESVQAAKNALTFFDHQYSIDMVGWERKNDDGFFLNILLCGKVIIKEEPKNIPADMLEAAKLAIEKYYTREGVRLNFLATSGTFLNYKEETEKEVAMGKLDFLCSFHRPVHRQQHGRRNR